MVDYSKFRFSTESIYSPGTHQYFFISLKKQKKQSFLYIFYPSSGGESHEIIERITPKISQNTVTKIISITLSIITFRIRPSHLWSLIVFSMNLYSNKLVTFLTHLPGRISSVTFPSHHFSTVYM